MPKIKDREPESSTLFSTILRVLIFGVNFVYFDKYVTIDNSDGTIEYGISNTTDYVCSDKLLNEITEEEFNKYYSVDLELLAER